MAWKVAVRLRWLLPELQIAVKSSTNVKFILDMRNLLIIFNILVIIGFSAVINNNVELSDYIGVWLLFLIPLVLFEIFIFIVAKFSTKLFKKLFS